MPDRLEDRLRRYLSARQPSPSADLERRSLERIFDGRTGRSRRFTLVAQLAAAALLVLLALGLAWTFRAARQPVGNHPSATPAASSTATPTATPSPTEGKPVLVGPRLSSIRMINSTVGWAQEPDRNGTLIRTDDGGHQWVQVLPGVSTLGAYYALNGNVVWVVESDAGAIYVGRSQDGGYRWQRSAPLPLSSGANVLSMVFGDVNQGWALVFQNGSTSLLHTLDSGMHWTAAPFKPTSGDASCPMGGISFLSATTGWLSTACGLYVSRDAGVTWQPQALSPAPSKGATQIFSVPTFFDQSNGYLVLAQTSNSVIGDQGNTTVYLTNDGGHTWIGRGTPTAGSLPSFTFADALHGWYVSTAYSTLMATTDGGVHWSAVSHDPALQNLASLEFTSPTIGFGQPGRSEQGLLKSVDGGRTWQAIQVAVGTP